MSQITYITENIASLPVSYQKDLALTFFSPIAHLPWAMLLRSAAPNHANNRFDILVANPDVTLQTYAQDTHIHHTQADTHSVSQDDPFSLLQHYLSQTLPSIEQDTELPFVGGALGYFSYDLGRRVETLPDIAQADPHAPDMAIGIYEWALVCDHQTQTAYVVGQNVETHYQWLLSQQTLSQTKPAPFALTSPWQANMSQSAYAQKFAQVQRYIQQGDCYQINLAQRFEASYQGDEWQAYLKLEASNHAPFSAFIRVANTCLLSVSPERFIYADSAMIETKPIKGTRPRYANLEQDQAAIDDLKSATKDQAENLMIVDLLRNDIGRVAKPGSVCVPHLFEVESFPAVHHLVSTIRATLDTGYQLTDLLRACFPGGSITGAPKVRAMQIIEELEPHRRDAYCGSIGYISRCGRMDTNISIRTLVARDQRLYAWAGGGLVADSQVDDEYQETLDKLGKILPVLTFESSSQSQS
ncbi:MAG: aminodeoxychorismate synthase component I [Vibrio sp.]